MRRFCQDRVAAAAARQNAVYEKLRRLFPAVFAGKPVPLKIAIHVDVIERLGLDDEDRIAMRAVLHNHVARRGYQTALAAKDAWRFDLDGNRVEPVSAKDQAQAQRALAALKAAKQKAG